MNSRYEALYSDAQLVSDGKTYNTRFYSPDAIISAGSELIVNRVDVGKEHIGLSYLDLPEDRARRRIPMTMEYWAKRLDRFLEFDEWEILQDSGKVTADIARYLTEIEFEKYRIVQDKLFESDFYRVIRELEQKKPCGRHG